MVHASTIYDCLSQHARHTGITPVQTTNKQSIASSDTRHNTHLRVEESGKSELVCRVAQLRVGLHHQFEHRRLEVFDLLNIQHEYQRPSDRGPHVSFCNRKQHHNEQFAKLALAARRLDSAAGTHSLMVPSSLCLCASSSKKDNLSCGLI